MIIFTYIYIYRLISSCYVVVLVFFARPVLSTGKFETTVLIKCACACVYIFIYIYAYVCFYYLICAYNGIFLSEEQYMR